MPKGPASAKREPDGDYITFEPRIAADKKSFVLKCSSSKAASWHDYLNAILDYLIAELEQIETPKDHPTAQ